MTLLIEQVGLDFETREIGLDSEDLCDLELEGEALGIRSWKVIRAEGSIDGEDAMLLLEPVG